MANVQFNSDFKEYSAFEYLLMDAATQFGKRETPTSPTLDKCTYEVRIAWARRNLDLLESLQQYAEEPAMYYAAVKAIRDAQAGIPIGRLVGHDAAASGIQLMSVMSGCSVGLENTGFLGNLEPSDIYTNLTTIMDRKEYLRKAVKNALMTNMYGSEAVPEKTFGKGGDLILFYNSVDKVCPGAMALNNAFMGALNAEATHYFWNAPDEFEVYRQVTTTKTFKNLMLDRLGSSFSFQCTVNGPDRKDRSMSANCTHSVDGYVVREMHRRCNHDKVQLINALNVINGLIGSTVVTDRKKVPSLVHIEGLTLAKARNMDYNFLAQLREVIEECLSYPTFELVTIHDEFKCLANFCNEKRRYYNRICVELYQSDYLKDLLNQIYNTDQCVVPKELGLEETMLNSNYPIC